LNERLEIGVDRAKALDGGIQLGLLQLTVAGIIAPRSVEDAGCLQHGSHVPDQLRERKQVGHLAHCVVLADVDGVVLTTDSMRSCEGRRLPGPVVRTALVTSSGKQCSAPAAIVGLDKLQAARLRIGHHNRAAATNSDASRLREVAGNQSCLPLLALVLRAAVQAAVVCHKQRLGVGVERESDRALETSNFAHPRTCSLAV
jgi:hypothetical protein